MNAYSRHCGAQRHALSLLELIIVFVIVGIIAAIAVPRFGSASKNATATAIDATVATVRRAIQLYHAEHGRYPGYIVSDGTPDGTMFVKQLTLYSDLAGSTRAGLSFPAIYGPYLKAPFPTNPLNGLTTVAVMATPASTAPKRGATGWVAILSTGEFNVNAPGTGDVTVSDIRAGRVKDISGIDL